MRLWRVVDSAQLRSGHQKQLTEALPRLMQHQGPPSTGAVPQAMNKKIFDKQHFSTSISIEAQMHFGTMISWLANASVVSLWVHAMVYKLKLMEKNSTQNCSRIEVRGWIFCCCFCLNLHWIFFFLVSAFCLYYWRFYWRCLHQSSVKYFSSLVCLTISSRWNNNRPLDAVQFNGQH